MIRQTARDFCRQMAAAMKIRGPSVDELTESVLEMKVELGRRREEDLRGQIDAMETAARDALEQFGGQSGESLPMLAARLRQELDEAAARIAELENGFPRVRVVGESEAARLLREYRLALDAEAQADERADVARDDATDAFRHRAEVEKRILAVEIEEPAT